jgi:hypothetical protein
LGISLAVSERDGKFVYKFVTIVCVTRAAFASIAGIRIERRFVGKLNPVLLLPVFYELAARIAHHTDE